ncbi:MAG TPA: hypothetical protein VL096_16960 [Pirellulaceae bacterium]|nr:hypothetical protein [Pirellulaceae bacterium]
MHTVELLEQSLALAERIGYSVRHEWLGGTGGGACEFGGRKWLFVDLALNAIEQLEQVKEALQREPALALLELPPGLRTVLGANRAA